MFFMVFPWFSIIWKPTCSCFLATLMLFHNWNRIFSLMLKMAYPFLQTILATFAWKFMKIKENSVFHGVSLNFHNMKNNLLFISDNMLFHNWNRLFSLNFYMAYSFCEIFIYSSIEVHHNTENSFFHNVSFNLYNTKCSLLIISGNMDAIKQLKQIVFPFLDVVYPFVQLFLDEVE